MRQPPPTLHAWAVMMGGPPPPTCWRRPSDQRWAWQLTLQKPGEPRQKLPPLPQVSGLSCGVRHRHRKHASSHERPPQHARSGAPLCSCLEFALRYDSLLRHLCKASFSRMYSQGLRLSCRASGATSDARACNIATPEWSPLHLAAIVAN